MRRPFVYGARVGGVPTTHGLTAGRMVAMATAVRAAARAAPNIVGQVALRGGAVPRAELNVGALTVNILAHVAARCGAVATADVAAGADRARVGGGLVGAARSGRKRICVS